MVLSIVAAIVGIPGFVAAGFGFPGVDAVAFGSTSLIIASTIGGFALAWNANRRDAIVSAILLVGAVGLAFNAVYAAINYREIHEISIRGSSSPTSYRQALALICAPAIAGFCFLALGLGIMRKARRRDDGTEGRSRDGSGKGRNWGDGGEGRSRDDSGKGRNWGDGGNGKRRGEGREGIGGVKQAKNRGGRAQ